MTIQVPLGAERLRVAEAAERNLKMIREALGVNITARDGLVHLRGERGAVAVARTVLEHDSEGTLRLSVGGRAATDVVLGPSTRVLGPSVFLDLRYALDGRRRRCLRWLLPCDVPSDVLRRWTVVLPSAACVARS